MPAEDQAKAEEARLEANELLDVFLLEAGEALDSIHSNREILHARADDHEALRTIHRSLHTVKGSARMVGLKELGEVAAAVEGAVNKWLQSEKPATPGLLKFIDDAEAAFRGWVGSAASDGKRAH